MADFQMRAVSVIRDAIRMSRARIKFDKNT